VFFPVLTPIPSNALTPPLTFKFVVPPLPPPAPPQHTVDSAKYKHVIVLFGIWWEWEWTGEEEVIL